MQRWSTKKKHEGSKSVRRIAEKTNMWERNE